jgi:threonine dehydrogenase-like Zn-dependent dehydrogenase
MACKALAPLWNGVFWSRLSGLRYRDIPEPQPPNDDWVRLKTILGGICGTDLALLLQRQHPATVLRSLTSFPVVLGHENVARIEAVGAGVSKWRIGQRVCVEPALSCATRGITPLCCPCANGLFSLCENTSAGELPKGTMLGMNRFTSGSWAPCFIAHHSRLHAVPEDIPDRVAVLVDPLACSLHAVLRCRPQDDQRVLILGGGIIGMGIAACERALGGRARLTALVRHAHQGELMRAAGADEVIVSPASDNHRERYERVAAVSGGRRIAGLFGHQGMIGGFDMAYDCIGTGRSLTDCMNFVRARGTVVEVGTTQIGIVDSTSLWMSELTLIGAYGRQLEDVAGGRTHTYQLVFDLVRSGKLKIETWLSRTYHPSEYRRTFADLTTRGRSGIVKAAFSHEVS